MRFSLATAIAAFLVVTEVSATAVSRPNHARLARRMNRQKRCLQRGTNTPADFHAQSTPTSSSAAPAPAPSDDGGNDDSNNNNDSGNNNNSSGSLGRPGTIQAWSDVCGDPNASPDPQPTTGPNGAEWWLDCNIDKQGGWQPPPVTLQNIIYKSLQDALNTPGSPFGSCAPYLGSFQYWGQQLGIPDTLLASIALQESGCNPGATGPNGEIGLMQITPDKCRDDCYDAGNNIGLGGSYLAGVIQDCGGNVAEAMGRYNGWFRGMTVDDANNHPTCGSRNNLDYLQNVFNAYLQGVDPYTLNMGMYFNTRC